MSKRNTTERGQITVFLVAGILGLLVFSALALDGGLIYSDRRHVQNAADAASMAGGGAAGLILDQIVYDSFSCKLADVAMGRKIGVNKAVSVAASNGYTLSIGKGIIPGENEVTTDCTVIDHGGYEEKYVEIKVKIAEDVQTSLIHFFYNGPIRNVVESTVRVYPHKPLGFGTAILSMSEKCSGNEGGVIFSGGGASEIEIFGGGIFSNSCLEANGDPLDICIDDKPGGKNCDGDGSIFYTTGYKESGNPNLEPEPEISSGLMKEFPYPELTCEGLVDRGSHSGGDAIIQPGIYSKISLPNGPLTMKPGLYCLRGNFNVTGGALFGNGVTIYMETGDFTTAGNANVILNAPKGTSLDNCVPDVCPPALPGLLIYMDESNPGVVTLQGDADSSYVGTVFAPTGTIDVGGGISMLPTINTQLIGDRVNIHGNVTIKVNFRGSEVYNLPSTLDLTR